MTPQPILPGFESYETLCRYLNQTFGVSYMEYPGLGEGSPEQKQSTLRSLANSAKALDQKALDAVPATIDGREVWQSKANLGENCARIETFAVGDWVIRLIVIGPTSQAKSAVVERFLRSVKVK